jgi:hypothetical protein
MRTCRIVKRRNYIGVVYLVQTKRWWGWKPRQIQGRFGQIDYEFATPEEAEAFIENEKEYCISKDSVVKVIEDEL